MTQLFCAYLEAGFFSAVMILAVLLLRLLLRKAPRNALCILWLLVALRLLLPFQLESSVSLQPRFTPAAPVGSEVSSTQPQTAPMPSAPPDHEQSEVELTAILGGIWIGGAAAVLLYAVISYGIIRRRVRDAIPQGDGVWESHRIPGAFLLGYRKPKIYLPKGLHPQDREFILAHELTHIRRRDNWWKLLGMICIAFHWYNPLVWLSYRLLCRDIEVACDQQVIQDMSLEERKAYSFALLNSGKRMSHIIAYPVTFGEVSLKQRIQHVLSYRKPGFWITLTSAVLVLAVGVCFLTVPKDEPETPTIAMQEMELPALREQEAEPAQMQPEITEPVETQPEETKPAVTEPEVTEPTEPVTQEPNSYITDELRDMAEEINQSHGYEKYNSDASLLGPVTGSLDNTYLSDQFPSDPTPSHPSPPASATPWSYTPPAQRGPQLPSVTVRIFP